MSITVVNQGSVNMAQLGLHCLCTFAIVVHGKRLIQSSSTTSRRDCTVLSDEHHSLVQQRAIGQADAELANLDCAFVNLEGRADRRERISAEMARLGVHCSRVDAVNGSAAGVSGLDATTFSHMLALEHLNASLRNSGRQYGLILEDDAVWRLNNITKIKESLHGLPEWMQTHPVVLLSCNGQADEHPLVPEVGVQDVSWCQTASSYVVRADYIPKLWRNFKRAVESHVAEDQIWMELQPKQVDHWAMASPLLMKQGRSWSDLEHGTVDYGFVDRKEDADGVGKGGPRQVLLSLKAKTRLNARRAGWRASTGAAAAAASSASASAAASAAADVGAAAAGAGRAG